MSQEREIPANGLLLLEDISYAQDKEGAEDDVGPEHAMKEIAQRSDRTQPIAHSD